MAKGYDVGAPPVFGDVYSGMLAPVRGVSLITATERVENMPPLAGTAMAARDYLPSQAPAAVPLNILAGDNPNSTVPPQATDDPMGDFETPPIRPLMEPDKPVLLQQDLSITRVIQPNEDSPPEKEGVNQWGN